MPQVINTNNAAINAQRNLDKSQSDNAIALQRLSSGLRINSARDDAAGLAISTRFTAQAQGLEVAIRNTSDGVSLAQTAEGAIGSMTDNLLRIRELALQAANGTNTDVDREALNLEVQQLKVEIERVAQQTTFNGRYLLDGTFSEQVFQVGANKDETVAIDIQRATTDELGIREVNGISSVGVAAALEAGDLIINGFPVPPTNAFDDGISFRDNEQSAIAKAAAINTISDETNVEAVINGTFAIGSVYNTSLDRTMTLNINGIDIDLATDADLEPSVNLETIVTTLNEVSGLTGVTANFSGNPSEGVSLSAPDGRNIVLTQPGGTNASEFGLPNSNPTVTYSGSYTLISLDGSEVEITTDGDIANSGLSVATFQGDKANVMASDVGNLPLVAGDLVINGIPVGASLAGDDNASPVGSFSLPENSAIAKAAAINKITDLTGVTATPSPAIMIAGDLLPAPLAFGDTQTLVLNAEFSFTYTYAATDSIEVRRDRLVDLVNSQSGASGIVAEAVGNSFKLTAEDGRNLEITSYGGFASHIGLNSLVNTSQRGGLTLSSNSQIQINSTTLGIQSASGFRVGTYGSNEFGGAVEDIDISTVSGAIDALLSVDNAITTLSFQRAELGAVQNRFESNIENQQITSENINISNSRIRDADFASETAELSRSQVLQQAGISVASQANALPQSVLQLLQQ